ncbi:MAG: hypothetical protein HC896_09530 [Bacteroidales bacterium]|nr:hypothetical protein [Bacteroidales bacterium]
MKNNGYKAKHEPELKQSIPTKQPDSVSYYISRNEVFTKLPNDTNEIIMLGNSLTHNFEWHEVFTDINIKNRGINGDITKGIIQRLREVVESQPKKYLLRLGLMICFIGFGHRHHFLQLPGDSSNNQK